MQIQKRPSPNFNDRPAGQAAGAIVLHYTGMETGQSALERLTDKQAGVSAHYLLDTDGTLYALVDEHKRAWHAGVSHWRGVDNLNHTSIGIEIVNPGHEFGYQPFPDAQIESLLHLLAGITERWPIDPRCIVGHSDIAPTRKIDPGEYFPWQTLAHAGFGIWPDILEAQPNYVPLSPFSAPTPTGLTRYYAGMAKTSTQSPTQEALQRAAKGLAAIGYCAQDIDAHFEHVVAVFQQHWRPACCNGVLDADTFAAISAVADAFEAAS